MDKISISLESNFSDVRKFPINFITVDMLFETFSVEVKYLEDQSLQKIFPINGEFVDLNPAKEYIIPDERNNENDNQMVLDPLPKVIEQINPKEPQLKFLIQLRKHLSVESHPPIEQAIQLGVISKLVELLHSQSTEIQFESAWILTNIASGNTRQTQAVVQHGALPVFVELLNSPSEEVRDQVVWAIGNIAGVSVYLKLENVVWTISNLCRGKPKPEFSEISKILPFLLKILYSEDEVTVNDALWAISYISDGPNEMIQAVIESGLLFRVVNLLSHKSIEIQVPALRIVGNIVSGDDEQAQTVIDFNAVPHFLKLLSSDKGSIRKETCWTISNITAGTQDQIQTILDAGIIPKLVKIMDADLFAVKKEAAWAIANASSGGSVEQIEYLFNSIFNSTLFQYLFQYLFLYFNI
ncbi:importin alpha [Anaeramoeba ignava]|uniref:Importin alpha n=1 Tax=Anaeramoeba ignava TaxID=1746090 RepID=A0A9Q0RB52_ANAIG|nr:importin alpha [Anaeramoeba ignava]